MNVNKNEGECEGVSLHEIIPSYLRRSFRRCLIELISFIIDETNIIEEITQIEKSF